MTDKEILENNQIIATFMGAKVHKPYSDYEGVSGLIFYYDKNLSPVMRKNLPLSEIKYDTSWDWLMGVYTKCLQLGLDCEVRNYFIKTYAPYSRIYFTPFDENEKIIPERFIEVYYKVVLDFINHYNQNLLN